MLAGLSKGKIFVDMSTVSPAVSRALAAKVREKGADMVDSPVSGSVITFAGRQTVGHGGRAQGNFRAREAAAARISGQR